MDIEYVERQQREKGLKLSRGVATAVQVFEWLSIVLIAWAFLTQKIENIVLLAPKIEVIIRVVGYALIIVIVVAGSLMADLLKWTQLSSMLNIFHTKNYKSGAFIALIYIALAAGFITVEREMISNVGNEYAAVKKDSSKYTDDRNYTLRLSEKQAAELEYKESRKRIENSVCTECLDIKAKYSKELNVWKRKNGKTELDRKYINDNIRSIENKINTESKAAKDLHDAKIAKKLQDLEDSYNAETKEVKAAVQSITSRIDSAKNKNDLDIINRERKIKVIAIGTAWVTILLQLICRLSSFFDLKKLNRLNELFDENNPLLDFLQTLPIIGKYFEDNFWVVMFSNRRAQKEADKIKYEIFNTHNSNMKFMRQAKYISFLKANNYPNNFLSNIYFSFFVWKAEIDNDSLNSMKLAYDGKKSNPYEPTVLHEKISEKSSEMFEKVEETPIILQEETAENEENYYKSIITTFQMFYDDASEEDEDKPYYLSIVKTFTLFLNDLNEDKI